MGLCSTAPSVVEEMPTMLLFQQSDEATAVNGGLVWRSPDGEELPIRNIGYDSQWMYFNLKCMIVRR